MTESSAERRPCRWSHCHIYPRGPGPPARSDHASPAWQAVRRLRGRTALASPGQCEATTGGIANGRCRRPKESVMESLTRRFDGNPVMRWVLTFIGFNAALFAFVFFALWVTDSFGDFEMGSQGWVAMCLGIFLTSGLGVGLMALVFYSARWDYDENAYHVVPEDDQAHSTSQTTAPPAP